MFHKCSLLDIQNKLAKNVADTIFKHKYPRTCENKHIKTNVISGKKILHKFNDQLIYNLVNCFNLMRVSITSLSKKSLKDSVNVTNNEIVPLTYNFKYM